MAVAGMAVVSVPANFYFGFAAVCTIDDISRSRALAECLYQPLH
jgi:hypothetical protein